MRPATSSTLRPALLLLLAVFLLTAQSSQAQTACAYSLGGCKCNCEGLAGIPPQNPAPRSYDSFIIKAYQGAYGGIPACLERQFEYWQLDYQSYSSAALLEEAKRFVSTRFETQQSYDIPGIDPSGYTQTPEYEQRNPAWRTDRMAIESFVGDLYKAFLQRSPEPAGQCYWSNQVCEEGRKKGIEAFKVSGEFGLLVGGLFQGFEPSCADPDDPCQGQRICPPR